jgi:hypothetical protein
LKIRQRDILYCTVLPFFSVTIICLHTLYLLTKPHSHQIKGNYYHHTTIPYKKINNINTCTPTRNPSTTTMFFPVEFINDITTMIDDNSTKHYEQQRIATEENEETTHKRFAVNKARSKGSLLNYSFGFLFPFRSTISRHIHQPEDNCGGNSGLYRTVSSRGFLLI